MRAHTSGVTPQTGLTRRDLIGTAVVIGATAAATPDPTVGADLPSRGEFIVRQTRS